MTSIMATLEVNSNNSGLLFTDTDSLICEIKNEDVHEDFSKDREILHFSNYSRKSKYYDDSKKIVFGKMNKEIGCPVIRWYVWLKLNMYFFFVDDGSEHKNQRVWIKIIEKLLKQ